jgi:hypothetical protein
MLFRLDPAHPEEFGAGYFEVAQLTRVSPETYL